MEASSASDLQQLYATIHKSVSELIHAKNFYIALYDKQTETASFPYHVDDLDPQWEPRTKQKGLTEYVIRTGKPLLVTPEIFQQLLKSGEVDVVVSNRIDWIGVPLQDEAGTFGMLGAHCYTGEIRYQENDLDLLTFVSHQVSSAIRRKQDQEALRASVERYRNLFETMPLATWVIDTNTLQFLAVNQAAIDHYGYSRDEFLSMTIKEIRPPEELPALIEALPDISSSGAHRENWRHVKKDGTIIDVEVKTHPLMYEGRKARLAIVNDVTMRKKAEVELAYASEALRKSEQKYRLLTEHMPAITYIAEFGEFGKWIYVSPKIKTLGFNPDEWMANPYLYWNHVHPEDRQRVFEQERESHRTGNPYFCEYRLSSQDGVFHWFHDEGVSIDGHLFQGFMVDITERKTIERLKDELTSIVAHELRAPLTSVLGALGYLHSRDQGMNSQERKLIEIANKNSERMLRLINDLLDIDKIESGKMKLELRPVDLAEALQHAIENNQSFADQFQVKIAIKEKLSGMFVMADQDRLMQVLTNLLSNAAKFSPPNSVVEIRAQQMNREVRVCIVDSGEGIPMEFQSSVFEKFAQADSSGSKKGSGLGLSISKAIIEKMGGKIGFESVVGKGTTFYVDLPVATAIY